MCWCEALNLADFGHLSFFKIHVHITPLQEGSSHSPRISLLSLRRDSVKTTPHFLRPKFVLTAPLEDGEWDKVSQGGELVGRLSLVGGDLPSECA